MIGFNPTRPNYQPLVACVRSPPKHLQRSSDVSFTTAFHYKHLLDKRGVGGDTITEACMAHGNDYEAGRSD